MGVLQGCKASFIYNETMPSFFNLYVRKACKKQPNVVAQVLLEFFAQGFGCQVTYRQPYLMEDIRAVYSLKPICSLKSEKAALHVVWVLCFFLHLNKTQTKDKALNDLVLQMQVPFVIYQGN